MPKEGRRNGPFSYRLTRYAPGRAVPPHYHEELSLGLVIAGSLVEDFGRSSENAVSGSLVLKPRGAVHSNRFGHHGAVLLTIEEPQLLACGLNGRSARTWRWHHHPRLSRLAISLARELRAGDVAGAAEEALVGVLQAVTGSPQPAFQSGCPLWLKRIRDELHARPTRRPSVARFASEAGVHPVYLTRRFRAAYGCSVSEYVRHLRVREAASMVAGGGRALVEIAHDVGFADQSHFCRMFQTELGLSPGAFRRLLDLEVDQTRFETFNPDRI